MASTSGSASKASTIWTEKTTWIEKLNLIPGGYAESAAAIKTLLALTPTSVAETPTRSVVSANEPHLYTFGPEMEGSVSASTYLRPVQPRITGKWSTPLKQNSTPSARKDTTPAATPRSVSWGDLHASLFAYSLVYPFAPWRAISEIFYTGSSSISELMRNVDPENHCSTISEVMRHADNISPHPQRSSNSLAAAKPSSGSAFGSASSQGAPKADTRMQGPEAAEKAAVPRVPWTAWRDIRSKWQDEAAAQPHLPSLVKVAEKASAAWAVCMDPGDIFYKVDREVISGRMDISPVNHVGGTVSLIVREVPEVTKATTTFVMVVKVLEDFRAILVKVKPLEKSSRKVVPDPADSLQMLKSRYARGEVHSEDMLKWKRVPKGWTKWSKECSNPQDHEVFVSEATEGAEEGSATGVCATTVAE